MSHYIIQHIHSECHDQDVAETNKKDFERTYISDDINEVKRLVKAIADEFALKVISIDYNSESTLKFLTFYLELDDMLRFGFKGGYVVNTKDSDDDLATDLLVSDTVELIKSIELTSDLIDVKEKYLGNNGFDRMIKIGKIMSRLSKEEEENIDSVQDQIEE